MNNPPDCTACPLRKGAKQVVWGHGPAPATIMFVAEGPGKNEDIKGRPMVGQSGDELDKYCRDVGIDRYECFVDNVVKCRPPNDRDPKPAEIEACQAHLMEAIRNAKPRIIVALGAIATRWFRPNTTLEMVHGIPFKQSGVNLSYEEKSDRGVQWIDETSYYFPEPVIILPMYHPAYALRETKMMAIIQDDFKVLAKLLRGEALVGGVQDAYPKPSYTLIDHPLEHLAAISLPNTVAVDTETYGLNGAPWCMSYSFYPGTGRVILATNTEALAAFAKLVADPKQTTVLHNALYDLPVLAQMGIHPAKVVDTMVGAYNLQRLPQGLKALAYRLCGMEMGTYAEQVAPATREKAVAYLEDVRNEGMRGHWPTPEAVLTWDKGEPHIKQPQPIEKKAARILKDVEEKGVDPWERWHSIDLDEGRGIVEAELGPMVPGYLSDIPLEQAVRYAAQDADATLRVWPLIRDMLTDAELGDVFNTDVATIPIISDMMTTGMLVDKPQLAEFSAELGKEMTRLQGEISSHIHGAYINPDSPKQVSELLFGTLKLRPGKKTKGGAYYSTDDEIIGGLKGAHPVVAPILKYREYSKVKGTYTDPLQLQADKNSRVHTTLRNTRTATGRLSSADPNQQNVPVRTELGRRVRKAFLASPGCVLLSQDYSQIEMRVEAHVSQDREMIGVFLRDEDIHTFTAARMFGIRAEDVLEKEHRYPAKRVGFGVLFHIGVEHLLALLEEYGCEGWDAQSVQRLIDEWFLLYSGVAAHLQGVYREARRYGHVRDLFGRMRLVPEVKSAHQRIIQAGERQAGNMPAQGGAQGIIKKAMAALIPLYRQLQAEGEVCSPLIQIHDDLIFEVGKDVLPLVAPLFASVMESAVRLRVPTKVETKVGLNWATMEKYNGQAY